MGSTLNKSRVFFAVTCFLPGRANDLSAPRPSDVIGDLFSALVVFLKTMGVIKKGVNKMLQPHRNNGIGGVSGSPIHDILFTLGTNT